MARLPPNPDKLSSTLIYLGPVWPVDHPINMSAIFLRPAVRRILPKLVILLIVVYLGVGFFSVGTGRVGGIKNGGELAQKISTGAPVFVAFSAS